VVIKERLKMIYMHIGLTTFSLVKRLYVYQIRSIRIYLTTAAESLDLCKFD